MQKLTIIIPIYNAENTLKECIESILNQSKGDFEIILVNDGSTDNSGKVCDDYAEKDQRIKVFHNENHGVSYSRNFGILKTSHEFISFVDSDDFLEPSFVEDALSSMEGFDLSVWGIKKERPQGGWISYPYIPKNYYNRIDFYRDHLLSFAFWGPWSKVFKKSIIINNNLKFNESLLLGEDTLFLIDYLKHTQTIQVLDKVYYNYRYTENSLSNKSSLNRDEDFFKEIFKEVKGLRKTYGENIIFDSFLVQRYSNYLILKLREVYILNSYSKQDVLSVLRDEKKNLKKVILKGVNLFRVKLSLEKRIILLLIRFNPFLSFLNFQLSFFMKLYKWKHGL